MRFLLVFAIVLTSSLSYSQNIKFKITGQADTTVHLVKYFGKQLYYADTAQIVKGVVEFDGSKQKAGIMALYLPGQSPLEFIFNDEEVYIEADLMDMMSTAKAKKSEENKIFYPYVRFIRDKRKEVQLLVEERKKVEKDSEKYKTFSRQIDAINKEVPAYQNKVVDEHWDKFVARFIKMSIEVTIPEPPKDENGVITDSMFTYYYYKNHYWDNVDLTDERLVRTPVFHNKLKGYFTRNMTRTNWDTTITMAFGLCDQLDPKGDLFRYTVNWITNEHSLANNKVMGMDKVYYYMIGRYYCSTGDDGKPLAHWMDENKLDELCKNAKVHYNLVMGAKPPNLILRDTTDVTWHDFYSLDNEYTILYFWDPECGHCKKITPKLQVLYEKKWRDRNIDIFAVGKATGDDFEKWKAFVAKHGLEFINVAVTQTLYKAALKNASQFVPSLTTLESLNYQSTYDIYATPKVWVLDKDKKIVAYGLSLSQLEDFMDRLQNMQNIEKLFPIEDEDDNHKM